MKAAKIPANENDRIRKLQTLAVLDTPPEERFDRYTQFVSKVFDVPIATITLVDSDRQWHKSLIGLDGKEGPREEAFCAHTILEDDTLLVLDPTTDPRFKDNPVVLGDPKIRFYAGHPLLKQDGSALGTLCLVDSQPREFSAEDGKLLKEIATFVELELVNQQTASIDDESGLSNKQGFLMLGEHSLQVCQRMNLSVSVAYMFVKGILSFQTDKDKTKYHRLLSIIAESFQNTFRSSDVVGRWDDCGFVALLTNTSTKTIESLLAQLEHQMNKDIAGLCSQLNCEVVTGVTQGTPYCDLESLVFKAFLDLNNS